MSDPKPVRVEIPNAERALLVLGIDPFEEGERLDPLQALVDEVVGLRGQVSTLAGEAQRYTIPEGPVLRSFNLNDRVKVRVLREEVRRKTYERHRVPYNGPGTKDSAGFETLQLHQLAWAFGDEMSIGLNPPVEMTVFLAEGAPPESPARSILTPPWDAPKGSLLRRLYEAGSQGADLSPGDPDAREAAGVLAATLQLLGSLLAAKLPLGGSTIDLIRDLRRRIGEAP